MFESARRAYQNPWHTLDWWDLVGPSGAWMRGEGFKGLALESQTWGDVSLRNGEEFEIPSSLQAPALQSILARRGLSPVLITSEGGYDLRTYTGEVMVQQGAILTLPRSIEVFWLTGVHPLKGCLFMDACGRITTQSDEQTCWTSYHAFPRTPGLVATRLQGVKAWKTGEGADIVSKDLGEGVWEIDPAYACVEAVTF